MPNTVKIEGLKELDEALGELSKAAARGVLRRAGIKALEPVAETARRLAPDDPETGGDDLKAHIGVGTRLTARQAKLSRRSIRRGEADKNFVEVHVGVGAHRNAPQGVQQEFGNVNHGPQSFMRPAWDQHKMGVMDTVKTEMAKELQKAAERARRKAARLIAKANGG